jgi:hypothetical protein
LLGFIRNGTDSARKTVIDVLGGDGLVQRVAGSLGLSDLAVLTCDVSPYMVPRPGRRIAQHCCSEPTACCNVTSQSMVC